MITYCPRCGARFRDDVLGDLVDASRRCVDCALTVTDPPAMLARANSEDEVEYDLGEWQMTERGAATTALLDAEIPYRWEPDLVLVVPAVAEDEVDRLLDELDDVDELPDDGDAEDTDGDGGEDAQKAMADLFVATDRLQHDPDDSDVASDVLEAATTVRACLPPYGIERPVWRQIQAMASTLVTDVEEAVDEDTVAADARALREYLRDLV